MPFILHILTKSDDSLAQEIISRQMESPTTRVEVLDFTQLRPDYAGALEKIFAADSIEVW